MSTQHTPDQRLLADAARAINLAYAWDEGRIRVQGVGFTGHNPNYYYWNPLESDAFALRLVVRLQMDVRVYDDSTLVTVTLPDSDGEMQSYAEHHGIDAQEATRRAIVRAAGYVGRAAISKATGGAA